MDDDPRVQLCYHRDRLLLQDAGGTARSEGGGLKELQCSSSKTWAAMRCPASIQTQELRETGQCLPGTFRSSSPRPQGTPPPLDESGPVRPRTVTDLNFVADQKKLLPFSTCSTIFVRPTHGPHGGWRRCWLGCELVIDPMGRGRSRRSRGHCHTASSPPPG